MPNQPQASQNQQNNQMKASAQQNQKQSDNKQNEMNRNSTASGSKQNQSSQNQTDARTKDRNGDVGKDTDGDGRSVQPGHKAGEIDGDRQNRNKH